MSALRAHGCDPAEACPLSEFAAQTQTRYAAGVATWLNQ
jgi:hypothetical protein